MAQVNKISSFKSFTEVKNQEATMKLREENNAKRQETVGKIGAILDEMGLTALSELDEDKKQALIKKMFGSVSEDEAEEIEDKLNKLGKPKKLEEGNAFIYAAAKAKNAGKKDFTFNGKTYKVTLKTDTGLNEEFEFEGKTYKVEESKEADEASNILDDLLDERGGDMEELHGMSIEDALETVKSYGHSGAKAKKIAEELFGMCNESVVTEGVFYRMPKDVISDDLYLATKNLQNFYDRTAAGNDVDTGVIDTIIKALERAKKSVKKFNSKEEVAGTVYEEAVNEAEKFKSTKDFLDFLEEIDSMPEFAIKKIMGKDYIDTPGNYAEEAEDYDNDIEEYTISNMGKKDYEKLKTWWENNVAESLVNEAASTAGELASFISQNAKHFASFLKPKTLSAIANGNIVEIKPGSKSFTITVDFDKKTIDTTGKPAWPESTSYIEIMEYVKTTKFKLNESVVTESYRIGEDDWQSILSDLKRIGWTIEGWTAIKQIGKSTDRKHIELEYDDNDSVLWTVYVGDTVVKDNGQFNARGLDAEELDKELFKIKGIKESVVTEAEVKSDEEFKEYAMTVLKKAFGDEFDEAKAEEVVDGILKKCDGDYGAAVGMLTSSLGESTTNEAFDANKRVIELAKLLKKQKFIGSVYPEGDTINVFVDSGDTGTTMMWDDNEPGKVRMECEDDSYSETIDDKNDAVLNFFSNLDNALDESTTNEAFDANYWEDYHEKSTKITSLSKVANAVEDCVWDWNDNNEMGKENEVTSSGEKKVMNLAHDFFKAKGYISTDVIDAMIAQES